MKLFHAELDRFDDLASRRFRTFISAPMRLSPVSGY
jgi:hypothetical protein